MYIFVEFYFEILFKSKTNTDKALYSKAPYSVAYNMVLYSYIFFKAISKEVKPYVLFKISEGIELVLIILAQVYY